MNHTQLQLAVYAQRLQWLEKEEGYIKKKKVWKQTTPNTQEKKSPRKIVPKRHLTKKTNPNNYQTHCISNRLWRCLKISSKFMSYFQEWVCPISFGWFNCKTERAFPFTVSFSSYLGADKMNKLKFLNLTKVNFLPLLHFLLNPCYWHFQTKLILVH